MHNHMSLDRDGTRISHRERSKHERGIKPKTVNTISMTQSDLQLSHLVLHIFCFDSDAPN